MGFLLFPMYGLLMGLRLAALRAAGAPLKKGTNATLLITPSFLKFKQRSHANHTMRGLRYTRLILRLGFPLALAQTLQVLI